MPKFDNVSINLLFLELGWRYMYVVLNEIKKLFNGYEKNNKNNQRSCKINLFSSLLAHFPKIKLTLNLNLKYKLIYKLKYNE